MKITSSEGLGQDICLLEIIKADYLTEYEILVKFSNGMLVTIDFEEFLSKAQHLSITKYLNLSLFSQFEIIEGNLNWNDYDMIFPLEDLYSGQV